MRILSISTIPLLPYYGSGKTRLHWTEGLRKLGHEVDVLEPKDFEPFKKWKKAKSYRLALGIFFKVRRLLKTRSYDLVEFYGDEYWLLLVWLKKFKKDKPLLVAHTDAVELNDMDKAQRFWHVRKGINKWLFNTAHYRLSQKTFSLADKLVCGNTDDLQYVIEKKYFQANEAVCISPGIEESFHDLPFQPRKENIILFIGSWIERKGIKVIIPVINTVLADNPDYTFYIIGAGAGPGFVQKEFDAAIQDRIKVFQQMPLQALQAHALTASVFFFPSYSEGFGLALAEAMSCSCAVVCTPTGIGNELIHGEEALVCGFNEADKMISCINLLIQNEELRLKIAKNGWLRAKQYRWKEQVKKLESVYRNWLCR
ncbi:MAG TPA: glycosyltransferase family 4 protein [Parafilimonas sp.]|nr:glycosyltransferase family 4 protein [Parafilimonas sp.]